MPDIPALNSSLRFWGWVGYVATALVFIGVVGESIVELTSWVKSPLRKTTIGKVSALLLILGLATELTSGFKISQITDEITAILNKEAGEARAAAGEADKRAGEAFGRASAADERASTNEKEAARLTKLAEDERIARVELEDKIGWRRIGHTKQAKMASHLSRFPSESALIAYDPNDLEAATFAWDLAAMLRTARWDVSEPLEALSMREGPVPFGTNPPLSTGVRVWSTDDQISRNAALAIVKELSSSGFDAAISSDATALRWVQPTPTRVLVSVEHKPEGAQGGAKLRQQHSKKTMGQPPR
jgi:hypothetical protein